MSLAHRSSTALKLPSLHATTPPIDRLEQLTRWACDGHREDADAVARDRGLDE